MHLWLIEQSANKGYGTFDSAVVVADTEHGARHTHPYRYYTWGMWKAFYEDDLQECWGRKSDWSSEYDDTETSYSTWTVPSNVTVTLLGEAEDPTPRVVCASFNAG